MSSVTVCDLIENDDFYRQFLNNDFKDNLAQSLTISEQVRKLGEGIESLSLELQKQVLSKHDDLLSQAGYATKLESVLNTMNTHVQCLFSNAERLRSQIVTPYNNIELHTKVLERLHQASHILRRVNRIQQLSKRLNATSDPVQQATVLQELEQLALDEDLTDIEAVSSELRAARSQRQKVIKLANGSLLHGITSKNVVETTTATQIFINLGLIREAIEDVVVSAINDCRESLKNGLAESISPVNFRQKVWGVIEKTFSDEMYPQCRRIQFLRKVLTELNAGQDVEEITIRFWGRLGSEIVKELQAASPPVKQTLDQEYPNLLRCYTDLTAKLHDEENPVPPAESGLFSDWETPYLSSSLSKLLDPVHSMFDSITDSSGVPTHDKIDSLVRSISRELSLSMVDAGLELKVAKNVAKSLRMYGVKTEHRIATGPDAWQVIAGTQNASQQMNVGLANAAFYLHEHASRTLNNMVGSGLENEAANVVRDALAGFDALEHSILQPLVESVCRTADTIIVTMHQEQDWNKNQASSSGSCSPYMRELSQFLSRSFRTYLSGFEDRRALSTACSQVAVRCIELVVRHAALLRPLSAAGRLRLRADLNALEQALAILCPQLADLGHPYRLLRSVASIVTLEPAQLLDSQVVGSSVPHSTVLFMLFSHASSQQLPSPHQTAGWTVDRLSAWLDEHPSESDRLDLIAGTLQYYVTLIRKSNSTNYDSVYPIIKSLLETAVQNRVT